MKLLQIVNQTSGLAESLLSTIPFGINIVNEDGIILFFNDIFLKRYGRSAIGKKCSDVIRCDKKQCLNCPLRRQLDIGETATMEITDSVDGSVYEIIYTGMIFQGKKAYLELYRDITKRKQTANDLKKFELAVESASDAIVITNPDGKIVYANKIAGVMTGYAQAEMIGQGISLWGHLIENKDYETEIPFERVWNKIKKTKDYYSGELVNKHKNGETSITELHLAPVFDEDKHIIFFVATARDITKMKEIDRAKTEFVSLASHQLRTPLSGISLASELLLRNAGDYIDNDQKEYLTEIFNSAKKMSGLINDLLNMSRIELGTFNIKTELLYPIDAIDVIINNLKSQFNEKKIKIKKEFDHKCPTIFFDKNAFNLIFDNLLTNAIRYTPKGGHITVRVCLKKFAILINVSDTGCGIPPKEGNKIFSKLFRASNAQQIVPDGEGLGLYMAKMVADRLGLKIWFKPNRTGPGTTFYVLIPLI